MVEDLEPAENIGGGDPDATSINREGGPASTRAEAVVDRLGELYWRKAYGGRPAFECLVRTILSQNTSDTISQPAHEALIERYGGEDVDLAASLAAADPGQLADTISGAGLHNQKAARIIDIAQEILDEFDGAEGFAEFVSTENASTVRERLLAFTGVGPKTADCVLLFSGGRNGVFPVDTHVHRIYRRLGIAPPDADHETVREILEGQVPAEKCGFGHTATIQFGREYCTARTPACFDGDDACPLATFCDQVGVDPSTRTVSDPASIGR